MAHRLFVDEGRLASGEVVVEGADHRYLCRVLRLRPGDTVTLFDGRGGEAVAELVSADREIAKLLIRERRRGVAGAGVEVTLLLGLTKGEKFDLVVQKGTELGVRRIVPVQAARSVERLDGERGRARRERWLRIAREAARQSGRADVPEIDEVTSFAAALASAPPDALRLMPWEVSRGVSLRRALEAGKPARVVVAIGPEGGFTDEEAEAARAAGFLTVGLGPRILRSETAALAILAVLGYALGDLGG